MLAGERARRAARSNLAVCFLTRAADIADHLSSDEVEDAHEA